MMNIFSKIIRSLFLDTSYRDEGVDLSHWDPILKPEQAKKRIGFAIMKLTEGTFYVDAQLETMWKGVRQIEVRGGYHYQRSGMSWETQAKHFLKVASWFDLHIYALDLENTNNIYDDTFFCDTRRIIDYWRGYAPKGKKIVLYTNADTYKQLYYALKRYYPDAEQWLEGVELWYAWPSQVLKDPVLPSVRKTTWVFWQKSWTGTPEEWGTESFVDVNEFHGTHEELLAWVGTTTQLPQVPVEPPDPPATTIEPVTETQFYDAEVVLSGLRVVVRNYPQRTAGTQTGFYVSRGEKFSGHIWPGNNGYLWLKISAAARSELVGKWVAVRALDGSGTMIILRKPSAGTPAAGMPQLWQVLHDAQLGSLAPKRGNEGTGSGAPEIYPMMEKHFSHFTKDWQMLSYQVMKLPPKRWRAVFTWQRVITNHQGFERPGDPRADYVNGLNLGKPDPKYASLLFGGNVVTGRVDSDKDGEFLWVETLDAAKPAPTLAWVLERPWLTQIFTNVTFATGHVGNFPQGGGNPVRGLILASQPVKFRLKNLKMLPLGSPIPSPYYP